MWCLWDSNKNAPFPLKRCSKCTVYQSIEVLHGIYCVTGGGGGGGGPPAGGGDTGQFNRGVECPGGPRGGGGRRGGGGVCF